MQATAARRAASARGRPRFQPSWMSPGLTSHQQLDAGIAARQHAGRKALKKSKRPFDNYFRTQFRFSPRVRLPVIQSSGVISSYNAVKMMTDPKRVWSTPWDRGGSGACARRKRQDVLETTATAFGDDSVDRVVERLIEVRFAWDREDGVLCTSLVPGTLYSTTAHCRPYRNEVALSPLTSSNDLTSVVTGGAAHDRGELSSAAEEEGEVVMFAGTPVRIQRRTPLIRQKSIQTKRPHAHSSLGFSGVDTVPSLVLDVSHGPFVTSPSVPLMTLRWKGEHRVAASAQSSLQLLRRVRGVPVVGLAPRSSFLLLKALATVEVEEPALAVSLAIAVGENYNGFTDVECLEVLRCLRRLAFVRGLPELATPDINAATVSSLAAVSKGSEGAPALPRLYTEAALTDSMLSQYLGDAAPFLIGKIWGRLPEQSRHLLQHGYFLDWFDLMRLAIAASGPQRLPQRLPNSVTETPYAAKYFFFHHTLGLKESVLRTMVAAVRGTTTSATARSPTSSEQMQGSHHHQYTVPDMTTRSHRSAFAASSSAAPFPHLAFEVKEKVDKPLILWLCASLLVRIVAESLGDVVRHVGDLLHQHAALAAERAGELHGETSDEDSEADLLSLNNGDVSPPHGLCRPYPRFSNGSYQQIGCRKPKRVRVRLLPFEAFPRVARCFSCPYASVTEKVEARERERRQKRRSSGNGSNTRKIGGPSPSFTSSEFYNAVAAQSTTSLQSTFAAVLAESPRMVKQIERACAVLRWSTTVLQTCRELVRDLPRVVPPPVSLSAAERAAVVAAAGTTQRSEEYDEWARGTVAVEVRHALCYRYVRSAVQLHMDALFAYLPWDEMEAQWGEPVLTTGGGDAVAVVDSNVETTFGDEGTITIEKSGYYSFTADALEALLADGTVKEERKSPSTSAPLSEAEQRARAIMEELRECLEEFQVSVADMLEAHERFFDSPSANGSLTSK